ncbi:hypothetical protein J5N97_023030 [Dioscorea zingiberensis]|uniref:Uncharacterized protein n=1 Tax=Dioscorea zingiberensis TaxID=325984 RepID=A0A9D5CBJ1_9LILI|nr:hypothetical protein J5N97_023030 [Dioscorea zingiberensis]
MPQDMLLNATEREKKFMATDNEVVVSVLLSCSAVSSTSTYQFLRNYEDLNVFVLAGEAFCGVEAFEFRQRLKIVCENYVAAFHRQNIYALKMVLEKENWVKMPAEALLQMINLAGLTGDGAALIVPSAGYAFSQHFNASLKEFGGTCY